MISTSKTDTKIPDTKTDAGDCCILFTRFSKEMTYRFVLQGSQASLSLMEMQFRKPLLQVFVQHYPAAKLRYGTPGTGFRKILLSQVCKVYRFHIGKDTNYFLYCKNYPAVNILFPQGYGSFFRR